MTEAYQGSAENNATAFADLLAEARAVYKARPDVRAHPCQLGVDEDRFVPYVFVTTASSVLLDDDVLIERIKDAIDQRRSQADNYRRELEASRIRRQQSEARATPARGSVTAEWNRIASWSENCVPDWNAEFVTPSEDAWRHYAEATGIAWTPTLAEFYTVQNGTPGTMITPLGPFFSLDEMLYFRKMMLEAWADQPDDGAGDAGAFQSRFVKEFIPIAGSPDSVLVVDLRPGDARGSLGLYHGEDGLDSSPNWNDPGAFLADLASKLEGGGTFLSIWHPRVVDGQLEWPLDD
ncbi:hypothetical protein [Rhodococcus sp. ARC_M6]|uniref:hypothetical protein n=1 Tax=Rhodococcus sp. ARC_M6 TaxID=2928852 RepID=UPI001FB35036|nr:hypothetical protein [Rhodococcus sp. ARC_M6]MCJ0907420.1 hypothetical protein [Rhodococcus sp. ARC_M6]